MDRDIYAKLRAWKTSRRRKPLILEGARQVGKTYALKYIAQHDYKNSVYINFDKDHAAAQFFSGSIAAKDLIAKLEIYANCSIDPGHTLIIFDEIQEAPRALNSLKYFCEDAPEYHVVAAGSLLGVKVIQGEGFPVGKVNFLTMYPLNFYEFLSALGEQKLRVFVENINKPEPLPEPLHEKLLELLRFYCYIGGMPEVVASYVSDRNFSLVREIQNEILAAYERDFAKHAPRDQVMKLLDLWEQIPAQLAKENKKFMFSAIKKSARGREYSEAIKWLVDARMIYKCYRINVPHLPISAHMEHDIFKLYLLDVGLLGAMSNLSAKVILEQNQLFKEFKGAFTENLVAQTLKYHQTTALYYWASNSTAEVDFIIEHEAKIYPLEVKAGMSKHKKSLRVFDDKYAPEVLSRATTMNLLRYGRIINYPLYLLGNFPILRQK